MAEYIKREDVLDALCNASVPTFNLFGKPILDVDYVPAIKSIPAADVRPVVRGRWDDKPVAFFLKCSECGCCVGHRYDVFLDRGKLNFCPNCGAQMIGGDDDVL